MSDITGQPAPNAVSPIARTDRPGAVSKDPHHTPAQGREQRPDSHARGDQADPALRARDPAVSISASAAHLEVGEQVKQQVARIDAEGRPIIVTETATFALRPDAGLRPGDDVILAIVETGKNVAADLISRNGIVIDPPERLALVVIAVHFPEKPDAAPPSPTYTAPVPGPTPSSPQVQNVLYSRVMPAPLSNEQTTEALASLLGSKGPLAPPTKIPLADNPDAAIVRTSSSDLATLIAAQQGRSPNVGAYRTAMPPPAQPAPPDTSHFMPASSLTELNARPAPLQPGVGAVIQAFALDGSPKQIQLLDAAISRVPPTEVAEVATVRALPLADARALALPLTAFANNDAQLARVETSKGTFIMAYDKAVGLSGELVRVSDGAPQASALQSGQPHFSAKLTPPGSSTPRAVQVSLPREQAGAEQPGAARIVAVHTMRAFLTPDGPKTDLRLETTMGQITLTLPNAVRPITGDPIQILPPLPAAELASAPLAQQAAVMAASNPVQLATGWPSLQQSYALVAGASAPAASQLGTRDAGGGGKLTNSLMFFLHAAGRGRPEAWLGDEATRTLSAQNTKLLDILKQDISRLFSRAQDSNAEWRSLVLPFDMKAPDMPMVAMLFGQPGQLHPDRDGGGGRQDRGDDQERGQRFVVEVRFSVLGPVQLDGFIREQQFDLTLRSQAPLPPALRQDARDLFDAALAANGYAGRLYIADEGPFPVAVDAILAAQAQSAA